MTKLRVNKNELPMTNNSKKIEICKLLANSFLNVLKLISIRNMLSEQQKKANSDLLHKNGQHTSRRSAFHDPLLLYDNLKLCYVGTLLDNTTKATIYFYFQLKTLLYKRPYTHIHTHSLNARATQCYQTSLS